MNRIIPFSLALIISLPLLGGCTYAGESLLVQDKAHLRNPPINPIPDAMRGQPMVATPQSMRNRFSYYGLDHAE